MTQYNKKQIIYSLCLLANLGNNLQGNASEIQTEFTRELTETLNKKEVKELIGEWCVVWGPVIYQAPYSDVSDNAMYVVYNHDTSQYVIAIAQSNFSSWFNWFVESAMVKRMNKWRTKKAPEGSNPKIARGSFIGLKILRKMKFIDSSGSQLTLFDFLKKEIADKSNPVQVITTGHSLGGMLSPPLALWLYERQSEWDSEAQAIVETYPSANPAIGNQDFAEYLKSQIGENTHRIWNRLDLANYGWDISQLWRAPFIYMHNIPSNLHIPPTPLVLAFVAYAIYLVKGNNYQHIKPNTLPLSCDFSNKLTMECPFKYPMIECEDNDKDLVDLKCFLEQALFQHLDAYHELLGVQELTNLVQSKINKKQEEFDTEIIELGAKLRQELRNNAEMRIGILGNIG